MKVFNKTHLPESIDYNKKTYIRGEQTEKSVQVNVLSKNLRGRLDLHGKPYTPNTFYYNPIILNK